MALNVGELVAYLRLDDSQFNDAIGRVGGQARNAGQDVERGLGRGARGADDLSGAADRASGSTRRVGESAGLASRALATMGGILAGAVLVDYLTSAVKASSDLNETVSKGRQIFGSSAKTVEAWGQTAAKSVGLSKAAALEAATNFGNVFTQLGYTSDAAADLSTKVVQMSADLGSFNNLPTADVADKISAAFNGEYDSLQALIPGINAARVEQEAMAASGKTAAASLTAQEKAAAVLAIVQQDGAKAMGDFARTSDGFANSTKTATATVEDQKAALGDKLMPVVQTLMKLLTDIGIPALGAFGDVLGAVAGFAQPVIEALGVVLNAVSGLPTPVLVAVAAFGAALALSGPLATMGGVLTALKVKAIAMGVALKGAFLGNPIGIAIAAVVTAFAIFSSSSEEAGAATDAYRAHVDDLTASLDENTGAVTENTRATVAAKLGDDKLRALESLGIATAEYTDAILGNVTAQADVQDQIVRSANAAVTATAAYQQVAAQMAAAGVSADDLAKAALNQDWSSVATKVEAYNQSLAGQNNQIVGITDLQLGLTESTAGVRQAYTDLNGETAAVTASQETFGLRARAAGEGVDKAGEAAKGAVKPVADLSDAFADGVIDAGELAAQVDAVLLAMDKLAGRNGDAEASQRALNAQVRDYNEAVRDQPAADRELEQSKDDLTAAQVALTEAQNEYGAESVEARQAARDLADAEDELASKTAGVGAAADTAAEKTAELRQVMITAGQEAYNAAIAQKNFAGANDAAAAAMQGVKQSFINMQSPADIASGKAEAVATALLGIPSEVAATIDVETGNAVARLSDLQTRVNNLISSGAKASGATGGLGVTTAGNIKVQGGTLLKAVGGAVYGPGSGISDSINARLSNGEHVWTAREVKAAGGQNAVYAMRRAVLGYAQGGPVQTMRVNRFAGGGAVVGSALTGRAEFSPTLNVQVFVGDREITDIVDIRIAGSEIAPWKLRRAQRELERTDG